MRSAGKRIVAGVAAALLVAALGAAAWAAYFVYAPLRFAAEARDFDIEQGTSLRTIARKLHAGGILPDPWRFEILARALERSTAIKAGSYQISPEWSALQLLEAITGTSVRLDRITLVEGWTFRQMRHALDAHAGLRHDTSGKTDGEICGLIALDEAHPEGLFFPDTYHFAKGTSDLSVLRRASVRMRQVLLEQWGGRAEDLPVKSAYEALVLASIIEKESGRSSDRALIAGVFANRLRKGMKLQADPTVIYGLGESFDGNLRRRDLETDGPYNTYSRTGLPPTPIAMPSLASLSAAVRPQATNALYFVARGDGSSEFSESLAEHNRAVTKYQRQPVSGR